ncbi:MAG: sulfocyanin-like copper-binding protein [Gemmatimonadales bacterium]
MIHATQYNMLFPAAIIAALVLPASASAQSAADTAAPVPWLTSGTAAHTVTLRLEVTRPAGAPSALINGQRAGGLQVIVPLNWTVTWEWRSLDSTSAHSLVVMAEREKLPAEGGRAVFDNAMTRMVAAGLPAGQGDQTTFLADQPGWYWMLCGVPAHALEGEYIGLRVDPEARVGAVRAVGR